MSLPTRFFVIFIALAVFGSNVAGAQDRPTDATAHLREALPQLRYLAGFSEGLKQRIVEQAPGDAVGPLLQYLPRNVLTVIQVWGALGQIATVQQLIHDLQDPQQVDADWYSRGYNHGLAAGDARAILGVLRSVGVGARRLVAAPQWNPPPAFHKLPPQRLPDLPPGYAWGRQGGRWIPMHDPAVPAERFLVRVFENEAGQVQLVLKGVDRPFDATTVLAQPRGMKLARRAPSLDFHEQLPGGSIGPGWDRGHVIEHADTLVGPGVPKSTYLKDNFVPEPAWWNRGIRGPLVARIAKLGHGYRGTYYYGPNPRRTVDGTEIPDELLFVETDVVGRPLRAWRIPFTDPVHGPTGLQALDRFAVAVPSQTPTMPPPASRLPWPSPQWAWDSDDSYQVEQRRMQRWAQIQPLGPRRLRRGSNITIYARRYDPAWIHYNHARSASSPDYAHRIRVGSP